MSSQEKQALTAQVSKNGHVTKLNGVDDVVRQLGDPGRFQILNFLLLACNYFPAVFHHVAMAFYGYIPPHECRPKQFPSSDVIPFVASAGMTSYNVSGLNETGLGADRVTFLQCSAVVTSLSGPNRTDRCEAGDWEYGVSEKEMTVVMEWDLVCDQAYLVHLATTVYYIGVMLGGFLCGYLSDYLGRRPVMLTTLALLTVLGVGLAFVRQFVVFLVMRFFLGFCAQQAADLVERVAAFNKLDNPLGDYPEDVLNALQINHGHDNNDNKMNAKDAATSNRRCCGSLRQLFASPTMRKRNLVMFYVWLAGNVAYWGLTFNSTSLAGNRFLNFTLGASVEFVAYSIAIFVVRRFGRRNPLCAYFMVTTVCCLAVGLIPYRTADGTDLSVMVTAFSVMGKFAVGGIFSIIELYTVEIYPTVLRNVGAGFCAFWGRLGAVLAPQFLSLGFYTFRQMPSILFGSMTLLGGGLILILPDTSNLHLPDTVYEIDVQKPVLLRLESVSQKRRITRGED
nr:hypothetical protein BaRGS_025263 [Batillaria attramentaria]